MPDSTLFSEVTTRELAICMWCGVLLLVIIARHETRSLMVSLLTTVSSPKILIPSGIYVMYSMALIVFLHYVDLWSGVMLKDTALWIAFSGVPIYFSAVQPEKWSWTHVVKNQLRFTLLFEFLVNEYTFHIFIEIVLVPFFVLLGGMIGICKSEVKFAQVGRLLIILATIIGLFLLIRSLVLLVSDENISTRLLVLLLGMPLVLTFATTPLAYGFGLASAYEMLFQRLSANGNKDLTMIQYAHRKLLQHLMISRQRVVEFSARNAFELYQASSRFDIDRLIETDKSKMVQS